ncbi:MAG TPA: type II toxin-antitoxin system mRNA interferase toxin, RelE/StbE family [Candidatus Dormibacteraeota bacterium]|nr:type II toxin-antitoxin system mRNA interferase toxin, RelE/StbE family [Candidatus Dormibacteraeota bacterium]
MLVRFNTDFDRQFKERLTNRQKIQVLDSIDLFIDKPFRENFRNHALKGEWLGYRSISIGGDLRLHFKMIDDETAYFVAVGNHDQLYK